MSINRYDKTHDQLIKLAGNTILLDATASEIRSGTFSIQCQGDSGANATITFETPMPDTDYVVIFESNSPAAGEIGFRSKTTTGFNLYVLGGREDTTTYTFTGKYYAFRLVKLEGYTALQNKVNNPDSAPTENSTNLVTSGGVYDAIKNASSIFVGTAAEWAAETDKTDFNVALITDAGTVNAVDDTTGNTEVVANKNVVFKGTLAEWEALTTTEKKTYDEALITNDMDTGEVVDAVTDGDMRAVTSNAVAVGRPEYYNKQLTVTAYEAAQLSVTSAYLRGQKVVCKDGKTRIFGKIILGGVGNPNGEMNRHPCKLTGFPGLVTLLEGRLPCLIWSGWTGFYSMDNLATGVFAPIVAGGGSTTAEEACFTPVDVVVEVTE